MIPERVTDIVVEEEEEEGGRSSSFFRHRALVVPFASVAKSLRLSYKMTVNDPSMTVESLGALLSEATMDGRMDARLRVNAEQFGATALLNGTFSMPRVTSAAVQQRGNSKTLTGTMVALLVVGIVLALLIVAIAIGFYRFSSKIISPTKDAPV